MAFSGYVRLDGVDIADQVLDAIAITSGRTNYIDAISPASASGVIMSDALTSTTGVGSTIEVSVRGSQRFKGTITNLTRGRYHTSWTATSAGLGAYARVQAPEFTVRQIPYSGGTRTAALTYTALDVLYQAGLLTDAEFLAGADQAIAGLGAVATVVVGTTVGQFNIQANTALLRVGATIPAGSVVDQLNYLASHARAGTLQEDLRFSPTTTLVFTRDYTEDVIVASAYVDLDTESTQSLELVANKVRVTYGLGTNSYTSSDAAATDEFGLDIATAFDSVLNAAALAYGIVAGRYRPRWLAVPIIIDLKNMSSVTYASYSPLYTGRGWALGNLYAYIPSPYLPSPTFVEGYVETISASSHIAEVYCYDTIYTRDSQTWADVSATTTWAGVIPVDPTLTWYDMIGDRI